MIIEYSAKATNILPQRDVTGLPRICYNQNLFCHDSPRSVRIDKPERICHREISQSHRIREKQGPEFAFVCPKKVVIYFIYMK
ncbi:Uncharacterized protein dnm_065760 [Desulfonema magnum]|uniref:Uncharacterized protein n=1 Tax=Desulfonema magnum TaxID=45655 RepID=A0A975BS09_9BACT|nr:Uncharacterized protein dnm_065760 [Desulfonema magnum]